MSDSYFRDVAERFVRRADEAIASGEVVTQLPSWDDDQWGVPTAVVRSALFGVIKRGGRKAVENQLLAAWAGHEIRYTGFRLDQADLDCWLQVLHLARQSHLGQDIRFAARSFLRTIGRSVGGKDRVWLDRSLSRMQACGVRITTPQDQSYQGPLIADYFQDEKAGLFVVRINPLVSGLFDESFVKLSLAKRLALPPGLSRYMQGYIQSHRATEAAPHRVGVCRLRDLCGSETKALRSFRQKLRVSMEDQLEHEIVSRWHITKGDALEFVRPAASTTPP